MSAPRILLLSLEYPKWKDAGKFSYESNFGLEEGLAANGVRYFTAPIMFATEGSPWLRWAASIQSRVRGMEFDQVWFDIVHAGYPEGFLDWMSSLAPVRVGFFGESSAFDPVELATNPDVSRQRQAKVDRALPYATHIVAVDEVDVDRFNQAGKQPAFWWAAGRIPGAYIAAQPAPHMPGPALFHGTLYGRRREWIEHPALNGKLALGSSLEANSPWPAAYDELTESVEQALAGGVVPDQHSWDRVVDGIRRVRRACYPLWMQSLRQGCAVVNLPQYARAYASRVTQGLAAGVPVVTWEIPGRPRTKALFEDGAEILLYRGDSPEALAEQIARLQADPALGRGLAARGLAAMRARHTTEGYVHDLLGWIQDTAKAGSVTPPTEIVRSAAVGVIDTRAQLLEAKVWAEGTPLRLHLGCGEQRFEGYINIDYPSREHNVMKVRPDFETDIRAMQFPAGSVDEIRLHHVFEHFNRVTALAMLVRWHGWLKNGGRIVIETPDIEGCARVLLSQVSLKAKMGIIRHLAGDQAASWAYHVDHWFPERFHHTLHAFGFHSIDIQTNRWAVEPFLSNVTVRAAKGPVFTESELLAIADRLLWESLVADVEKPTWEVWRAQLRETLAGGRGHVLDAAVPAVGTEASPSSGTPGQVAGLEAITELCLGIKMLGHDAAVFSIIPERKEVFGMAEERITRYKHDDLFPLDAIQRMLEYRQINPAEIRKLRVGGAFLCQRDERLPVLHYELTKAWREFFGARYSKDFKSASTAFFALPQAEQIGKLKSTPKGVELLRLLSSSEATSGTRSLHEHYLSHLQRIFPNARIELNYHDHEFCHAVSAYFSSGFDEALVVAFDGWGDEGTFSRVYRASSGRFVELAKCVSPIRQLRVRDGANPIVHECSVGGIYSCFTQLLGFTPDSDEGKTEALAAFGRWDNALYQQLMRLTEISTEKGICIHHAAAESALRWDRLEQWLQTLSREDVAAAVQKFAEDTVLAFLKPLVESTGLRRICLSGGVMANVILNHKIRQQLADEVYIAPAMADDGAAQGAAILELLQRGDSIQSLQWYRDQELPYWGTSYEPEDARRRIDQFVSSNGAALEVTALSDSWPEEAAERICRGEVGAIFHGRMEWGPRALGNRSIIADARNPKIRDIINRDIKNRPHFQPFCPSMLAEERGRLFESAYLNKHMTIAFEMKREFWDLLPGAIHIDGTSRVQFVTEKDNPCYHRLLSRVKAITGYGVIVNTSFNKHGRTIVESPEDALRDFTDSKLDFVIIEGCLVTKKAVAAPAPKPAPQGHDVGALIFSKDRPLQLEATLRSLAWQSRDLPTFPVRVLFKASSPEAAQHYRALAAEHPNVSFIPENSFHKNLVQAISDLTHVLLAVDDCLFVQDFSFTEISNKLKQDSSLVGCSLRLGRNTTYCYPLDRNQAVPVFRNEGGRLRSFEWTGAEHDFGYPLEVSSSIYRVSDLLPLLREVRMTNPNVLEARLAESVARFKETRPRLLCFESSRAFCAPWNKVQTTYDNRAAVSKALDPSTLMRQYAEGQRIDLDRYAGHVPRGCHEEVDLHLKAGGISPEVSVVIPCYNQAEFVRECLESLRAQTFTSWEAVVVNDGSTDDSVARVREFVSRNPTLRIRIVHRENGGLSAARNSGFRASSASWVLPLDADDVLAPSMLQKVVHAARGAGGVQVVFTDVQQFGARNDLWITGQGEPSSVVNNTRHAYCALIQKAAWEKVGGYRSNMVWGYEDWDFWVGCHEHGIREIKVSEPLFFYRTKQESMLTRALDHDAELRAQIVLNHPVLFDEATRRAAAVLLQNSPGPRTAKSSVDSLLQGASVKFGQNDAAGACFLLEQAVALAPDRSDILESYGAVCYQISRFDEAFRAFQNAVGREGEPSLDLLLKLAMAAVKCGQIEVFESTVERILAREPRHPGACRLLAVLCAESLRWADAGRWYQRILETDPKDPDALLGIGRVFAEADELEAARATYQELLGIQPDNTLAAENLQVIEARIESRRQPAIPPGCRPVDPDLAAAEKAYAENRLYEAEECLSRAAARRPEDSEAWSALGSLRFQMGRFLDAQLAFTRVTLIEQGNAEAWVKLAQAAVRSFDYVVFESALARALELDPASENAHRLLLRLNLEQEHFSDAARIARALLERFPNDVELVLSLGVCFAKCGELDAAAASFEEALRLDPGNATARENLVAVRSGGSEPPASGSPAQLPEIVRESGAASWPVPSTARPEISVILPTYNRGAILALCLEGFASQRIDWHRFEVVIVDDGSSPSVEPFVSRFHGRLNLVYQWQPNAGLAAARNAAIASASAPLLALHDDDDVPAPDYLERCLAFHAANPDESDVLLARLTPAPSLPATPLLEWVFDAANGVIGFPEPAGVHGYSRFYGGTSSCKRSIFRHANYNPEYRFGFEDMEFGYRLSRRMAVRVHYHPEVCSMLVREVKFDSLFLRLYREGRSLRRFYEASGKDAFEIIPPAMNRSSDVLSTFEPRINEIIALVKRLEGPAGYRDVSITVDGRLYRGADALKMAYSLAAKYSRAAGWIDFARGINEQDGLLRMSGHLEERPSEASRDRTGISQKRALVYFHCNPHPARSGAHRRCLTVLRALRELGYEIVLASSDLFTDQPWSDDSVLGLERDLSVRTRIHSPSAQDVAEVRSAQASGDLWSMHTPVGLRKWFVQQFEEIRPELVLINYAYHSALVADPVFNGCTKVVEMHDLVTLGGAMMRSLVGAMGSESNPGSATTSQILNEDFFSRQGLEVSPAEIAAYANFDSVLAISRQEGELVSKRIPDAHVTWLPVTAEVPHLQNTYSEPPVFVAFGNGFNLQGFLYFCERVLPEVLRQVPDFKLRVVGDLCSRVKPRPGIELMGFVPDLQVVYERAAFAICPLLGGTGQQVKVAEAMAHGLAVVVHANVAGSSPVLDGVNGFVAADAASFAARIVELSRDASLCRRLGEASRVTLLRDFNRETFRRRLASALKSVSESPEDGGTGVPAPKVTLPVRWHAPFFNSSGYASEAIQFALSLSDRVELGIEHKNRIYSESFVLGLPEKERVMLKSLESKSRKLTGGIVVTHMPAPGFQRVEDAAYHIGRTMFETDSLPANWVAACNRMDEVWVPSHFQVDTFSRAGVSPEKIHVVPGVIDLNAFDPAKAGPLPLKGRAAFNFLAVFEWTSRKGWDVLLSAYLREFSAADDVCLFLKCFLPDEPDSDATPELRARIADFANSLRLGDKALPRIEILGRQIGSSEMPALYKAVDCLVAPSRGEGWGRPQHEAMAMGLPVIATGWSGVTEFLDDKTGFPVEFDLVKARGLEPALWHYHGHLWAEPRESHLRSLMRQVQRDPAAARLRGSSGMQLVREKFSAAAVASIIVRRLAAIERSLKMPSCPSVPAPLRLPDDAPLNRSLKVSWEGPFLDFGSLAHVNREFTSALQGDERIGLFRVGKNVIPPELARVSSLLETARTLHAQPPARCDIHIRHSWPPSWESTGDAALVWFQPWEYGTLPTDWVRQSGKAREIWTYSNYCRNVFVNSGVDPSRVQVVPLGIDPEAFKPGLTPLPLPVRARFKFLFVGGTIHRKGPDVLLRAFLDAFTAVDDVCLVIKDFGGNGVYAGQTLHEAIASARSRPNAPEILHLDEELAPEMLPRLYAACDALVHPYRGEGFGLPVLEAMACGLPVIVTAGGSTDDFATDEFAYRIPSLHRQLGSKVGDLPLVHQGWLLEPDCSALTQMLGNVFRNPESARSKGLAAAQHVRMNWTWERSARVAVLRLRNLAHRMDLEKAAKIARRSRKAVSVELPPAALVGNLKNARRLFDSGNLKDAWADALRAIEVRPYHPEAYRMLSDIAAAAGDGTISARCLKVAREMAPEWNGARKGASSAKKNPARHALELSLPLRASRPRLTICMIVRNEARFLDRCLLSVNGIADQIICVDTGSTDGTIDIARKHGAEVHSFAWNDDFSAARNHALAQARGDWILAIDADEELDPGSVERLRSALGSSRVFAWRLPIIDVGQEDRGRSFVPRLFRNAPGLFYVGRIHEQVFTSLEVRRQQWGLENRLGEPLLLHHGYTAELTRDRRKNARNLALLEKAVDEFPNEPALLLNFGLELNRAGHKSAAIEQYEEAWQVLSSMPAGDVVPELRESLLVQLASILLDAGEPERVVQIVDSPAARKATRCASLHFSLGLALIQLQQYVEAAEQMKCCLQKRDEPALSPMLPEVRSVAPRHCFAVALAMSRKQVEAAAAFHEALMEDPHARPLLWDFARFEFDSGRPLECLKVLHKLISADASDLEAWKFGAHVALGRTDFAEFALDWTAEAVKHFPTHQGLLVSRAEALTATGRFPEAATAWGAVHGAQSASQAAARILCDISRGACSTRFDAASEMRVSQEFVQWYRRIVEFNATDAILRINGRMDLVKVVLPSAANVLAQALEEAGTAPAGV